MNTTEIQKKIAYDLTLEFIRQNNKFKGDNVEDKVKIFKEIYDCMYKSVKENNL